MSALLLGVFVVTAAGVPLPAVKRPVKSGELFPCATNGCGCDSAERCWRSCCCHTLAERLAWARRNGVRPPAFALAEAKRIGLDTGAPMPAKRPCCASRHAAPKEIAESSGGFVAWRALACRGQSLDWLAAVPTLVTVRLELSDQLSFADWLGPTVSSHADGRSDAPTVPPPERV